uniref:Uncharacterized protein n=1 Tax=Methylophaga nitratireducenticrescens TaxID=754476 RepID=I1XEX2_METNJ
MKIFFNSSFSQKKQDPDRDYDIQQSEYTDMALYNVKATQKQKH